jgi:hypothetical protein
MTCCGGLEAQTNMSCTQTKVARYFFCLYFPREPICPSYGFIFYFFFLSALIILRAALSLRGRSLSFLWLTISYHVFSRCLHLRSCARFPTPLLFWFCFPFFFFSSSVRTITPYFHIVIHQFVSVGVPRWCSSQQQQGAPCYKTCNLRKGKKIYVIECANVTIVTNTYLGYEDNLLCKVHSRSYRGGEGNLRKPCCGKRVPRENPFHFIIAAITASFAVHSPIKLELFPQLRTKYDPIGQFF